MRSYILAGCVLAVALALLSVSEAPAQKDKQPRQYYDKTWSYNKTEDYHYKTYHYKPNANDKEYKQQIVVYKPKVSKDYVYWYNPDTKAYWARCPTVNHTKYGADVKKGKDYWGLVHDDKKKPALSDYKEADYKETKEESPYIPDCKDKVKIDCPPTDLPKG